jgi:hypothetical protein
MESLKACLEARLCHPIGNILIVIADGNNLSLKKKLDFIDCTKTKTKPNSISEKKNQLPIMQKYGLVST